eukprot:382730-Prorocentrum_minimum.AAC.2
MDKSILTCSSLRPALISRLSRPIVRTVQKAVPKRGDRAPVARRWSLTRSDSFGIQRAVGVTDGGVVRRRATKNQASPAVSSGERSGIARM